MPERIESGDLDRLAAALRGLRADAAGQVTDALGAGLRERILPRVNARTPVGKSKRLVGSNRVDVAGATIAVVNPVVYANAIHWGRRFWPNQTSALARPSVIEGRAFIWDTVVDERLGLERDIEDSLERAFEAAVPQH